jgi:predicted flap endonuclease-1-like 5' DNA nuclease
MGLLYRIIYAAHAKGTHHKLALDALAHLDGPDAAVWRRLFLKHADTYMAGSKAPDDVFKDFKNHCLHPRDKFWGGAPATARQWYVKTVSALAEQKWSDAVHAAGILSHYVTDVVHPFHTAQSEAENSIHRAFEWSTAKSYDALKSAASGGAVGEVIVPDRADWLEEMLRQGAVRANRYYEKLIAHYDINRGVVDPPSGLDVVAQRIVGDLILYAARLYGVILGHALAEAQVQPPSVSLSIDLVLATLKIPVKLLAKRMADSADRKLVERMYDELRATGTVELTLPEDDRIMRDLHAAEVVGHTARVVAEAAPVSTLAARLAATRSEPADTPPSPPAPVAPSSSQPDLIEPVASSKSDLRPPRARAEPAMGGSVPSIRPRAMAHSTPRSRLALGDNVVEAPSIGPRMAERLAGLGVFTVQDLLNEQPAALAQAIQMSAITADTIADWQAQARLVCAVPGLTGTGAQLFVGAGYRDVDALAAADPDTLSSDLLAFAGSDKGRRILRDGAPPDLARIKGWAENARSAIAA